MQYATEENLTDLALERWEGCHSPRLRTIMQSLVKHLHGFVREVDLTQEEWLFAANWLAKTGQLSSEKRQEFILLSDVLGISMLVDAINHRWSDVVFGVKEKLIAEFKRQPAGKTPTGDVSSKPFYIVNYDFTLSKSDT